MIRLPPGARRIELPPALSLKCWEFGNELDALYRRHAAEWGTDFGLYDPRRAAASKVGECVCAIHLRLDPLAVVRFVVGEGDGGSDVPFKGLTIDVKDTRPEYEYLYWPVLKLDKFEPGRFDLMVLTKSWIARDGSRAVGYCQGWLTKDEFRRLRRIAPDGLSDPRHLAPGTPHVQEKALNPMTMFPGLDEELPVEVEPPPPNPFHGRCECGAPGLYHHFDGFVITGKSLWFCNDHRPDFRALGRRL